MENPGNKILTIKFLSFRNPIKRLEISINNKLGKKSQGKAMEILPFFLIVVFLFILSFMGIQERDLEVG